MALLRYLKYLVIVVGLISVLIALLTNEQTIQIRAIFWSVGILGMFLSTGWELWKIGAGGGKVGLIARLMAILCIIVAVINGVGTCIFVDWYINRFG